MKAKYCVPCLFALLLLMGTSAGAGLTPWFPSTETTVTQILTHYYTTWQRVNDFPLPGDQWWYETDGLALAEAKFAGYTHQFGYASGLGASTPASWTSVQGSGYSASFVGGSVVIQGDPFFRPFLRANNGAFTYSSVMSANENGLDHMLSFEILTDTNPEGGTNSAGNYVIFWEDSYNFNVDQDYNDLVVEMSQVAPVPEPGTVLLLGLGLVGAGVTIVRRRRRS